MAVAEFFRTGHTAQLRPFAGKRVAGVTLETRPSVLRRMYEAGELSPADFYSEVGA